MHLATLTYQVPADLVAAVQWLPIDGYEGIYEVSDTGQVRRVDTGHLMSPFKVYDGYLLFKLSKKSKRRDYRAHILVANAFLGPGAEGQQVNHKDLDKTNNRVANLEWVTAAENMAHFLSSDKGAAWKRRKYKLNEDDVAQIRALKPTRTMTQLAEQFGVSHTTICEIVNHQKWSPEKRKTAQIVAAGAHAA